MRGMLSEKWAQNTDFPEILSAKIRSSAQDPGDFGGKAVQALHLFGSLDSQNGECIAQYLQYGLTHLKA